MSDVDAVLEHYGVKGMHWGVRRLSGGSKSTSPPSEDAAAARAAQEKAKTSGLHTLSNKELQSLTTRLNLEQQFNKLNVPEKTKGKKFAEELLYGDSPKLALMGASLVVSKVDDPRVKKGLAVANYLVNNRPQQKKKKK